MEDKKVEERKVTGDGDEDQMNDLQQEYSNIVNVASHKNQTFYIYLGKKILQSFDTVEFHALGNASALAVTAAENLVRNGYAEYAGVQTQTVDVEQRRRGRRGEEGGEQGKANVKRVKLLVTLKKSLDFDENLAKFNAIKEENEKYLKNLKSNDEPGKEPGEWAEWKGDKDVPVDPELVQAAGKIQSQIGLGKYKLEIDAANFIITIGGKSAIEIIQRDITAEETDAITNAANGQLAHGGGVAGAIKKVAGGASFQQESTEYIKKNGPLPTGAACFTSAGGQASKLRCKHVIHCVGPMYQESKKEWCELTLHSAILNTLQRAKEIKAQSVSIPAISSGIFGFPKERCVEIILQTCVNWLALNINQSPVKKVRLCNFDTPTVLLFRKEFQKKYASK